MKFFSKLLQTDAYRIKELDKMAGVMAGIAVEYASKQDVIRATANDMKNSEPNSEIYKFGSGVLANAFKEKHQLEEQINKMSAKMQRLVEGIKDPGARVSAEKIAEKIKERIPSEVQVEPVQKIARKR